MDASCRGCLQSKPESVYLFLGVSLLLILNIVPNGELGGDTLNVDDLNSASRDSRLDSGGRDKAGAGGGVRMNSNSAVSVHSMTNITLNILFIVNWYTNFVRVSLNIYIQKVDLMHTHARLQLMLFRLSVSARTG